VKKVKRIWLIISALLAFAAAGGVFYFSYTAYDRLVATTEVVVAAEDIEPYTVITSDHLRLREMPRAILDEEIYVSEEDVVGRIAISRIPAEAMIYRPLAVAPSRFRYVSDPELEVVSIPVDPARAVGGQIKIGHVVNVYRAARSTRRPEASDPITVLSQEGAAVELLTSAPVVDVRNSEGGAVRRQAAASQTEQEVETSGSPTLEIVTLGVPSEIADDLVRLAVEQKSDYELWLSLAPATAEARARQAATDEASPPVSVRVEKTSQGVELSWPGSGSEASRYVIYCRNPDDGAWRPVASVPTEDGDNGEYEHTVSCPESDCYGVAAIAPDGERGVIRTAAASRPDESSQATGQ
jgi:Flp pilus assembly protein CpaB